MRYIELPFYDTPGPIAVVHRGGDLAGMEQQNSIQAFVSAQEAGYTYGETDVVATADEQLIVFHGAKNRRDQKKTGLPLREDVIAMTLDEVRQKYTAGGEQIPLLSELLEAVPDMKFFVDPKTDNAVVPLVRTLIDSHAQERVSIGSFDYARTQCVAELIGYRRLATSYGFAGSLALAGSAIGVPKCREYLADTPPDQFTMPHQLVTPRMVEIADDIGRRVTVWTPNEQSQIEDALIEGAYGVISDRTVLTKQLVDMYAGHAEHTS